MSRFRKKPVVVDAIRWLGGDYECLNKFCGFHWGRADAKDADWLGPDDGEQVVLWNTLENQWLCCPKGHWVIRGLKGELYPCDPDIFAATYEPEQVGGCPGSPGLSEAKDTPLTSTGGRTEEVERAAIRLWTRFHIDPIRYERDASSWLVAKSAKYGPTAAYEDAARAALSPSLGEKE